MGGALFIRSAILVGMIIKWFDWLYELGKTEPNRYKAAILQGFCFGAVFNIIVLAREGGLFRVARGVLLHYFRRLSGAGEVAVLAVRYRRADQASDARPRAGVPPRANGLL